MLVIRVCCIFPLAGTPIRFGLCKKLERITTLQFDCPVDVGFYLFGAFEVSVGTP